MALVVTLLPPLSVQKTHRSEVTAVRGDVSVVCVSVRWW